MVWNCALKYPLGTQIGLAFLAVIVDFVVLFVVGIVAIYTEYLIQGLKKDTFLRLGPVCLVNAAVIHVWIKYFFANPTYKAFNKRSSKWVAFGVYYGIIFVGGYLLGRSEYYVFKNVFHYIADKSKFSSLISFHQLITFIVLTSHSWWFDAVFLKEAHAFASFVIQFLATFIVWGIWCHNVVTAQDNSGQLGGYTLWIPLTNLYPLTIFHDLDLSKTFPNLTTRVGFMAGATLVMNFIQWAIAYGITYGIYGLDIWNMNSAEVGHSISNMAAATLVPQLIVGHRLSPYFFKRTCVEPNGQNKWVNIIIYWFVMLAIIVGLSALVFLYVHKFFYNVVICQWLQAYPTVNQCLETPFYHRSVAFFGFGVGTIYIAFMEGKMFSRDAVHLPDPWKQPLHIEEPQDTPNSQQPMLQYETVQIRQM